MQYCCLKNYFQQNKRLTCIFVTMVTSDNKNNQITRELRLTQVMFYFVGGCFVLRDWIFGGYCLGAFFFVYIHFFGLLFLLVLVFWIHISILCFMSTGPILAYHGIKHSLKWWKIKIRNKNRILHAPGEIHIMTEQNF